MKKSLLLSLGLLAAIAGPLPAESPEGFVDLFNGENLDGWHGRPHFSPIKFAELSDEERATKVAEWTKDASEHWTVENGELVNDGHGAYLVTDKDYRDYELHLQYKTVPIADSGIYLKGNPQVQIWDVNNEAQFKHGNQKGSGGLWNNSPGAPGKDPLVKADKPLGEWNDVRILQVGARTSVWLNDQLVVDHAIMENYWNRETPLFVSGPIELQTHGGEIRWRNLKIRELSTEDANKVLADKNADQFQSIFNGNDLEGWIGATNGYEVVDGAVRCKKGSGGNLLTEKEYANFVVRLEFKLPAGGNNGLAIRSPLKGNPAYDAMCELQVLDSTHPKYANLDERQYHGSAYGMAAATRGFLRPVGQWNFQEVTVNGSKIKVELNGTVILDTDLSQVSEYMADSAHPGKDRPSGHFGFAGHGDAVEFRSLSIQEL
ncbi:DUF1080 domain-containing protein [Roseiconus lacunae]|uniref:DUF1080 domain-containing protein n=1 Tax=Roseiconus lacunae TaxID=2605694 RepID=A0ABT7PHL6_9BACT|nr:DUF1080 domain-containing protein [Roseiconus lacunae]MCD0458804.1 DUF1080 domain-containing protein [Roseiconus lacunae]MDM4015784.1 DUF1080 domain-containing protein [Roseiconus lacunae]WRQ52389.1 DUF1080 domain-containing protein [Stieleria sp. HD01]